MMVNNVILKKRFFLNATVIGVISFVLVILTVNSATWFRVKRAQGFIERGQTDSALSILKKAFRKETLSPDRRIFDLRKIAVKDFIAVELNSLYLKSANQSLENATTFFKSRLRDANNFEKSMDEYLKIIELKNDYDVALGENTMATVEWDVILTKTKNKKATDCFIFGEELVESQKWDDARMFYTKEILKYLSPVDVLQALHKLYPKGGRKSEKEHIWGGDIFVILEDFEEKDAPVLGPWAKSSEPRVNEHSISEEEAVSGKSSEYFNVEYAGGRNDYWAKTVDIPLNNPDLSLGIRVFIKSNGSFKGDLRVNTTYPPSGRCGITSSTYRKNLENGWIEYGLENLYEKARENGLQHKWSVDNMKIDKVLIDTSCAFCKFYVDDIQLYIVE